MPLETDYKAIKLESNLDVLNRELATVGSDIEELKAMLI